MGTEELWVYVADKGGYYRFDERATPVNAVQQVYGRAEYFVRRPDGHSIIPLPEHCTPFVGLFRDMAINSNDASHAVHATLGAVMLQWLNPYTFHFKAGSGEQAQIWTFSSLLDAYLEIGNWKNALSEAKNNPTRSHKRLVDMMVPQQVSCARQQEEEECVDAGEEPQINKSIEDVSKAQQNVSSSPAADSAPCSASAAAAAPGEPGMPSVRRLEPGRKVAPSSSGRCWTSLVALRTLRRWSTLARAARSTPIAPALTRRTWPTPTRCLLSSAKAPRWTRHASATMEKWATEAASAKARAPQSA